MDANVRRVSGRAKNPGEYSKDGHGIWTGVNPAGEYYNFRTKREAASWAGGVWKPYSWDKDNGKR